MDPELVHQDALSMGEVIESVELRVSREEHGGGELATQETEEREGLLSEGDRD